MVRFSKSFSTALSLFLLIAFGSETVWARFTPQQPSVSEQAQKEIDKAKKEEKKKKKRSQKSDSKKNKQADQRELVETTATQPNGAPSNGSQSNGVRAEGDDMVAIVADRQSRNGDLSLFEGYVNATLGDVRLQADRITYNIATGDMVAEGNVIFDQGADQRVTARRAEINWASRRGTFWDTTGFTNRTATGEYIFFTAERVEKTGPETFELINATVTACEDVVPKWSFSAKRAELKVEDRIKLYNSVFRIKSIPAFVLPFAWIPATRSERKSGFLLPQTGSSNQKGREFKFAYYQTLGQSADITFRNDIYTARGLGFGAQFRAQTDEKSFMNLGFFSVKDRLFGPEGEDQGGTAFVADAVQYLPHGWLAVGNVSLVSSLRFRQVFSDDISQVIDPRRESTFYINNNTGNVSFNFLTANETTRLLRPARDTEATDVSGTDFDIKIRRAPELNLTFYPKRIFDSLPIYFSFDSTLGALKREEAVDSDIVLVTPSAVQRLDFQPKITIPLATFGGIAITPSLSVRETFYTSSIDPSATVFDPETFASSPDDPRLDPASPEFDPAVKLFERELGDPIIPESFVRQYGELTVDIRPPSLEKIFLNEDGSRRFKHVIEPYITYRLIGGVGDDFERVIRFDERDAVANTNEVEYAVVNRFFTMRKASEVRRKRARRQNYDAPDEMEPVDPGRNRERKRNKDKANKKEPGAKESDGAKESGDPDTQAPPAEAVAKSVEPEAQISKDKAEAADATSDKKKLERGEQQEMAKGKTEPQKRESQQREAQPADAASQDDQTDADDTALEATNENAPTQPYEFLMIKVAQKYFFDRDFGGALTPGKRNQFYPINTLSGFTFGGKARSFSPANVQIRYRPLASLFADLRMDIGSDDEALRNMTVSAGVSNDTLTVSASYYLSRRIDLAPNSFEPGTFPGSQIVTTLQFGDDSRGLYGGTRIGYDFTDRLISEGTVSKGRLRNSRSYIGHQWDCCGLQFNYNTFKAGLRNESAFSFTFTLAGLGSFGTDQFAQLGGNSRRSRKRSRRNRFDDFQ
jgi:lipopolysaccharide assembly outer membrane protein LptD (OstA)